MPIGGHSVHVCMVSCKQLAPYLRFIPTAVSEFSAMIYVLMIAMLKCSDLMKYRQLASSEFWVMTVTFPRLQGCTC